MLGGNGYGKAETTDERTHVGTTIDFRIDGLEGDVGVGVGGEGGGFGGGLVGCGLEFAVDSYVHILVETGIGLEAGFGGGMTFADIEVMVEETEFPFEGFGGIGVLEGVGLALGFFDEITVGYAGSRPCLREMVGV